MLRTRKHASLVAAVVLVVAGMSGLGAVQSAYAGTAALPATDYTYTVVSTADSIDPNLNDHACAAPCGLRAAIQQANANCTTGTSPDPTISTTIRFDIPGSGVQTITPAPLSGSHPGPLPGIVCPVVIDGTSQPGYAGKPLIELDGTASAAAGSLAPGLQFTANHTGSTVLGLAINRWHGAGIALSGPGGGDAAGFIIQSNYIGTDPTGTVARPNIGDAIAVSGNAHATIGGTGSGEGNLLSGNGDQKSSSARGVDFGPGTPAGSTVQGNLIGTDITGTKALPNHGDGVFLNGNTGTIIGGTAAGAGNVIGGNTGNGIAAFGTAAGSYTIQGNRIGVQADGVSALGNGAFGIALQNTAGGDVVGGVSAGMGNTVAYNQKAGIQVGAGTSHRISGNAVFNNGGLGIDLTPCTNGACPGPTVDDATDADTGPNQFQNFPVVTSVVSSSTGSTVKGSLKGAASASFTLEFFASPSCDASGYGEARTFLGTKTVTTTASGSAKFSVALSPTVPPGSVVSATATDVAGNTSELSPCRGPLTVSPVSGGQSSVAKVSGRGFGAGQTVTLLWNCATNACSGTTSPVLGTVTTSSTGSFNGKAITVPTAPFGSYWIGARTGSTFATTQFNVVPVLTIAPTSGTSGSSVTVSGTGYGPNEAVKVRWNCGTSACTGAVLLTAQTGTNGNFSARATIPTASSGTYPVGGKGGTSKAFTTTPFTIS